MNIQSLFFCTFTFSIILDHTDLKIRYLIRAILLLLPYLCFTGCKSSFDITATDVNSMYTDNREASLRITDIIHIDDSVSTVNVIVPKIKEGALPKANKIRDGLLKYEIFKPGKHISLTDSASIVIPDSLFDDQVQIRNLRFACKTGSEYILKLTYLPAGSHSKLFVMEEIDKKNRLSPGWCRFRYENGEFLKANLAAYPQPCRMICPEEQDGEYFVKIYSRKFETPYPPFSEIMRPAFNYKADSIFLIRMKNGVSDLFTPSLTGFYVFQKDTSQKRGTVLYRMNAGFPRITEYSQMVENLRYITSTKEYKQLIQNPAPKLAVDSFWIACAGRADLASELIRRYYGRVEISNELFTSYTEGWRTDRGMIYIIFGKPTQVFRNFGQEVWVYGESASPSSLKFFFVKADNPFTNNDYVLTRRDFYKSFWYQNVQAWRR